MLVLIRKRVIILRRYEYVLKNIKRRLEEEGTVVSMRSLQQLCTKFEKMCTIQDLPRVPKRRLLTPQMLSTMYKSLHNDDELTARKLKAHLRDQFTDLPDVLSPTIKR